MHFTVRNVLNTGTQILCFQFISSLHPWISDESTVYPADKIGVLFSGLGSFRNATYLDGFYCVSDSTGYIIVPEEN